MGEERAPIATKYFLGSLDIDGVSRMPDLTGACQQFVQRGNANLAGSRLSVPMESWRGFSEFVSFPRRVLDRLELEILALDIWEKYGIDGLASDRRMAALGGLRLCLISAVQFLGTEETKKITHDAYSPDMRANLVAYFYGLYSAEYQRLHNKGKGRSLAELRTLEATIEENLKQRSASTA